MDQISNFLKLTIDDTIIAIVVGLVLMFVFRFFKEMIRSWIWGERAKGVIRRYMDRKKEEEKSDKIL